MRQHTHTCASTEAGSHTITTADGNLAATLVVTAADLASITILPATATISIGATQTYSATGFDAANNSLGGVKAETTFTITTGGSCSSATCTSSGAGDYTVTATDSTFTAA